MHRLELDPGGRSFVSRDAGGLVVVSFTPPLVQPIAAGVRSAQDYVAALSCGIGTQLVVLLQASAAALGLWRDDELLEHKATKRYVVRGSGRAQPAQLRAQGRSSPGARLRLRNARALLSDVNERLGQWRAAHGPCDLVFHGCPVRLWSDLFRTRPPPPFRWNESTKIPLDVRVPTFAELQRVRRRLARGVVAVRGTAERDGA